MNGTVISLMFLTIAHNNASFVIAKKIMNDYDSWFNGWVIQNIGVFTITTILGITLWLLILFDEICRQIRSFHHHVLHKFQLGIKTARLNRI